MMNHSLTLLLVFLIALPSLAQAFDFDVLLNNKLIGRHQIKIDVDTEGRTVVQGHADYTVKLLGITLFTYQHQHREVWEGKCLKAFASTTSTNGEIEQLTLTRTPEGYTVITLKEDNQFSSDPLTCAWSYAYWRKGFTAQRQLMNGQTGELIDVSFERLTAEMPIGERASAMKPASAAELPNVGIGGRYKLVTKDQTIIVHYSPAGIWNGLNVDLAPNRTLTYRPRSTL